MSDHEFDDYGYGPDRYEGADIDEVLALMRDEFSGDPVEREPMGGDPYWNQDPF